MANTRAQLVETNDAITYATQTNVPMSSEAFAAIWRRREEESQPEVFPSLSYALVGIAASSEWSPQSQPFRRWSAGSAIEAAIGSGSGQQGSPFSVSLSDFVRECAHVGFSSRFLGKVYGKRSMFEHYVTFDAGTKTASSLELLMASYEDDAFFLLLRFDIKRKRVRALIFLKLENTLNGAPRSLDQFIGYLDASTSWLQRDPFLLATIILSFFQHESFSYVRWRQALYSMESRLGVTRKASALKKGGYEPLSSDYDRLNADLAGLAREIAEMTLSASTTLEHAKNLLRLAELCQTYPSEESARGASGGRTSEMLEEIQSTINRAELYLKNMEMVDAVQRSMAAVLYNRINKHDSDSMKTIAVVTLLFLPATFVSSVFSTGVFNFHAAEGDYPQVVSRYGWLYLLLCILLTCLALIVWVCWYYWGSLWLEKLRLNKVHRVLEKSLLDVLPTHQIDSKTATPSTTGKKGKDIEAGNMPTSSETVGLDPKDMALLVEKIDKILKEHMLQ
jgi:CorA-like Mg2+ transporter protein